MGSCWFYRGFAEAWHSSAYLRRQPQGGTSLVWHALTSRGTTVASVALLIEHLIANRLNPRTRRFISLLATRFYLVSPRRSSHSTSSSVVANKQLIRRLIHSFIHSTTRAPSIARELISSVCRALFFLKKRLPTFFNLMKRVHLHSFLLVSSGR